jgi:hypothetical protein
MRILTRVITLAVITTLVVCAIGIQFNLPYSWDNQLTRPAFGLCLFGWALTLAVYDFGKGRQ